jgi:hypothetical protein
MSKLKVSEQEANIKTAQNQAAAPDAASLPESRVGFWVYYWYN